MTTLITGGGGYIGSHFAWACADAGRDCLVLDDLSTGSSEALPASVTLVEGDVGDEALLREITEKYPIDAIVHFAGSIVVPESVTDPLGYYSNNTVKSRSLIEAAVRAGISRFVFSSTAAVYGEARSVPVSEEAPLAPVSPYGRSKLMTEWMLEDAARAHGLRSVVLRYFNVAGSDPEGRTGQRGREATHLIKIATQVALGRREVLSLFGTDYPTPDGTGVRDYIHVSDLADAHLRALDWLERGGEGGTFNCGYGRGYSVREVVAAVERVIGRSLPVREAPRRAGDPPVIVADASRLKGKLDWRPRHDDIDEIVRTAYAWEQSLARRDSGQDDNG